MKKIRNIGLILGLIILISTNSNAQYYYTSYGYAQDWHLPKYVQHSIYDNYYGYEVAHVRRYQRHGHQNFNVLLHRNGWYVEIRLDQHGYIYKTVRHRYNYPLMAHNCTSHCGYHKTYYQAYYPKYHHNHNYYSKTVYVNTDHGHQKKYHKNYYTNVHVEKQHKQQNSYKGNNHGSQNTQRNVNYNNKQQTRTNTVIHKKSTQQNRTNTAVRKPQQTNTRNVGHQRPQSTGNSKRIQHMNPQRVTTKKSNSSSANRLMTYKNERGSRDR